MKTMIHEATDGKLVEYRRFPYDPTILFLEARELRRDGTPYDDRWYLVTDAGLLNLQLSGSDIVDELSRDG